MDLPPPIPVSARATPLPLEFHRPQGWPEPSIDWLAANQGWDPPAGWTPAPGIEPAPAEWVWWTRDEVGWKAMTGTVISRIRVGIAVSAAAFVVGATLTILPETHHLDIGFLFWGALIFGPINLFRNLGGLRRAQAAFLAFVRSRAAEVRQTLDTSTYGEHVALHGPDSLRFDRFLTQRAAESWSFSGHWPADQNHIGVTEQFRIPETPAHARDRRLVTAVLAGVAGVALVVMAANALGASDLGSGAGSPALENAGSGSGGSTAIVSGSASAEGPASSLAGHSRALLTSLVLTPQTPSEATCAGPSNCFVIRVSAASSCTTARVVVEFYASAGARVADRHQVLTVPLTGSRYTDFAVDEPNGTDVFAAVKDSYCVRK